MSRFLGLIMKQVIILWCHNSLDIFEVTTIKEFLLCYLFLCSKRSPVWVHIYNIIYSCALNVMRSPLCALLWHHHLFLCSEACEIINICALNDVIYSCVVRFMNPRPFMLFVMSFILVVWSFWSIIHILSTQTRYKWYGTYDVMYC